MKSNSAKPPSLTCRPFFVVNVVACFARCSSSAFARCSASTLFRCSSSASTQAYNRLHFPSPHYRDSRDFFFRGKSRRSILNPTASPCIGSISVFSPECFQRPGRGPWSFSREAQHPERPLFHPIPHTRLLLRPPALLESAPIYGFAYPAGTGRAAIRRTVFSNKRRLR